MREMRLREANSIFLFLLLISLFYIPTAFSQTIPRTSISGTVWDASTGKPLHFANVFLNNTTLGCATDENGGYSIEKVPLGTYSMVASMMGYELDIRQIKLTESDIRTFEFNLHPKVVEGDSVTVTAKYPHQWKKNLKKFKKLFLGTTSYARKCRIENPEVLDFTYDRRKWTFKAFAINPLIIENRALGYRVKYILMDFQRRGRIHLNYKGLAYFEELKPETEKESKRWKKNRIKTFKGSTRHFYASLATEGFRKEGFRVYNVHNPFEIQYKDHVSVMRPKDLLSPAHFPFEKRLSFDRYLIIEFGSATSWLTMRVDTTVINTLGLIYDPYHIVIHGFWTQERVANKLPWDFMPVLRDK